MKTLHIKLIGLFLGFVSLSAFSTEVPQLYCKVKNPCMHSAASSLGFCLRSKFTVHQGSENQQGYAIISTSNEVGASNQTLNKKIPLHFQSSGGVSLISGSTDEGATWLALSPKNFSRFPEIYWGSLTVDEDFSFAVDCYLYQD